MTYRTSVQAPKEPNNVPKNIHQQLTTRHLWDEIAMVITLVAGKDKAQKTFSNFHKGLCIRSMNLKGFLLVPGNISMKFKITPFCPM